MGQALLEGTGHTRDDATIIVDNVRARDKERMTLQLKDGILAGREILHSKPVPEPLTQPRKKGVALDEQTREVLHDD